MIKKDLIITSNTILPLTPEVNTLKLYGDSVNFKKVFNRFKNNKQIKKLIIDSKYNTQDISLTDIFQCFPALDYLNIYGSNFEFTKEETYKDKYSSLKVFILEIKSYNNFKWLNSIVNKLLELYVTNTEVGPEIFMNLPRTLKRFYLVGDKISSIKCFFGIEDCTELVDFKVNGTKTTTLYNLLDLKNLKHIDVRDNNLLGVILIEDFSKLKTLYLSKNSDPIYLKLENNYQLHSIELDTGIESIRMFNCPKLVRIDFNKN